MGKFRMLDGYIEKHQIPFKVIKVKSSIARRFIARICGSNLIRLAFPILLKSWQHDAFVAALNAHQQSSFDSAHQLGPIGFRNPGYLWKLDCHTYWGPIGGAQYIRLESIKNKCSLFFIEAVIRNASTALAPNSRYIKKAAMGYNALSFATTDNKQFFERHFLRSGNVISDQGLSILSGDVNLIEGFNQNLTVVWAGSISSRKNIDALIDIIRLCPPSITFRICGSGPLQSKLQARVGTCHNVEILGQVNRDKLAQVLKSSDVLLITSLSEANTAILLESLENLCIPIVPYAFGFKSLLSSSCAYLISHASHASFVRNCAQSICSLRSPGARREKQKELIKLLPSLTWESIAEQHISHYEY